MDLRKSRIDYDHVFPPIVSGRTKNAAQVRSELCLKANDKLIVDGRKNPPLALYQRLGNEYVGLNFLARTNEQVSEHVKGMSFIPVCTGAGKQIADYTLARSSLSQFFTTVVTADDVSEPKPNPEGLRMVMETIRVHSDQTVYVADHPNEIEASRNAGVRTAAACWGSKHRRALYDLRPDFLLKHPSEVLLHFH